MLSDSQDIIVTCDVETLEKSKTKYLPENQTN